MLPKKYRLPAGLKLQNPQSFPTQFFRILIKENGLSYSRFGFVVSKKIDKRAVVRNRLKRVLRELVYPHVEEGTGKDMLFMVTKSFYDEATSSIQELVEELFTKVA